MHVCRKCDKCSEMACIICSVDEFTRMGRPLTIHIQTHASQYHHCFVIKMYHEGSVSKANRLFLESQVAIMNEPSCIKKQWSQTILSILDRDRPRSNIEASMNYRGERFISPHRQYMFSGACNTCWEVTFTHFTNTLWRHTECGIPFGRSRALISQTLWRHIE